MTNFKVANANPATTPTTTVEPVPTLLNKLKKPSYRKDPAMRFKKKKSSIAESMSGVISDSVSTAVVDKQHMGNVYGDMEIDPVTGLNIPLVEVACFDKLQRRLLVITRYQNILLFNFNCGELLETIEPTLPSCKFGMILGEHFFSSLTFEHVWCGQTKNERKLIFTGTDSGCVFGLHDDAGDIVLEPILSLVRPSDVTSKRANQFDDFGLDSRSRVSAPQSRPQTGRGSVVSKRSRNSTMRPPVLGGEFDTLSAVEDSVSGTVCTFIFT